MPNALGGGKERRGRIDHRNGKEDADGGNREAKREGDGRRVFAK